MPRGLRPIFMHVMQKVPTPPVIRRKPRCTGGFRILRPPFRPPETPPVRPPFWFDTDEVARIQEQWSSRWHEGSWTGGRREVSATGLPSSNPFLQRRFRRKREVGRLNQHFSLEVSIIIPIFAPCIPMHTLYNQNHKEQICKQ